MKLAVFDDYRIGVVEGDSVYDVTAVVPEALCELRVHMNWLIGHWPSAMPEVIACREKAEPLALKAVRLRPPSPSPSHIFAARSNYGEPRDGRKTARENGILLKSPGSLAGAADGIRLPQGAVRRFDHQSELAVIIGPRARNVPRSEAMRHVFGYACLVDATPRIEPGTQDAARSMDSSFATCTPLGPYIVTTDEVPDPQSLDNRLWVNGKLRQEANTRDMIVDIAGLIELVSSMVTLNPGDVLASGTPEGVGPVNPGDRVKIAIDQVGEMTLAVTAQRAPPPRTY